MKYNITDESYVGRNEFYIEPTIQFWKRIYYKFTLAYDDKWYFRVETSNESEDDIKKVFSILIYALLNTDTVNPIPKSFYLEHKPQLELRRNISREEVLKGAKLFIPIKFDYSKIDIDDNTFTYTHNNFAELA